MITEILNFITAMQEFSLFAVNVSDLRGTGGGGGEARIEGKMFSFGVETSNVYERILLGGEKDREVIGLAINSECAMGGRQRDLRMKVGVFG